MKHCEILGHEVKQSTAHYQTGKRSKWISVHIWTASDRHCWQASAPLQFGQALTGTLLSRTLFFKRFSGLVIHVLKILSGSVCKSVAPISCRSTILVRQSNRTRTASAGFRIWRVRALSPAFILFLLHIYQYLLVPLGWWKKSCLKNFIIIRETLEYTSKAGSLSPKGAVFFAPAQVF